MKHLARAAVSALLGGLLLVTPVVASETHTDTIQEISNRAVAAWTDGDIEGYEAGKQELLDIFYDETTPPSCRQYVDVLLLAYEFAELRDDYPDSEFQPLFFQDMLTVLGIAQNNCKLAI